MSNKYTCNICHRHAFINTLASGSLSCELWENRSKSWCVCPDRNTNPDKKILGKVEYMLPIKTGAE